MRITKAHFVRYTIIVMVLGILWVSPDTRIAESKEDKTLTTRKAYASEKWKKSAARVKAHDMPPDGMDQPSDGEEHKQGIRNLSESETKYRHLGPVSQ
ncbi:MAG TPA: hypothetical protein DIT97_18090 [Gimesia maris]|uniref:Uncharacterized protein n=1 Tax=Gimesia maris TaxID=122 RepID=A0A3D3R9S7_9PLAN|nr:hypothetical protein [Gimesia maris]|tara:strand:+ start:18224 stop:18517 length:294 start_codon:yes stop_codon:yes gene_type:complete